MYGSPAQVVRGAGGAAIVRPHSHERPVLIRYLNAGADGIMVPMVDTADQARASRRCGALRLPSDHEKRLVVSMVETLDAIENLDEMLTVEGIDVFFIGPATCRRTWVTRPHPRSVSHVRKRSWRRSLMRSTRSVPRERSLGRW